MFVLLIHLRDAVWSVYPSREVLFVRACKQTHRCRCFTVSAPRYDSPLFHLPPLASVTLIKITQLCARRCEPDDTIAHMQKNTLPFLFFYLPPLPLSNWFSPLYGRPLASAFDPYSTLTSACPYQRRLWAKQIVYSNKRPTFSILQALQKSADPSPYGYYAISRSNLWIKVWQSNNGWVATSAETNNYFHCQLICEMFSWLFDNSSVHKMERGCEKCQCILKPKVTSSDVLFCPQPKDVQFTVIKE